MLYDLYLVDGADPAPLEEMGIPVTGTFQELLSKVDIVLDASPGGVGAKNKELYEKAGVKAIFQGGEKNTVADVFFHGYANYEKGVGQDYLKLTSCNTTGLIRAVECLDRAYGKRPPLPSFAAWQIPAISIAVSSMPCRWRRHPRIRRWI